MKLIPLFGGLIVLIMIDFVYLFGVFRFPRLLSDRPQPPTHGLSFSQRQCSVKALHAEPKHNDLMAPGECKSLSLNFFLQSHYLFQSFVIILMI